MKNTILLVEDDVLQAISIQNYLEKNEYKTFLAINYEEAISFLSNNAIDTVVLDINLRGEKTGLDIGNYIKTKYKNISIIFVTSYTDKQTLAQIKETGAVTFLSKPVKSIDLLVALELGKKNMPEIIVIQVEVGKQIYHLKVEEIQYIESQHVYIKIKQNKDKDLLLRYSIKLILEKLPPHFKQISRSVIINSNYIDWQSSSELSIAGQNFKISSIYQ